MGFFSVPVASKNLLPAPGSTAFGDGLASGNCCPSLLGAQPSIQKLAVLLGDGETFLQSVY